MLSLRATEQYFEPVKAIIILASASKPEFALIQGELINLLNTTRFQNVASDWGLNPLLLTSDNICASMQTASGYQISNTMVFWQDIANYTNYLQLIVYGLTVPKSSDNITVFIKISDQHGNNYLESSPVTIANFLPANNSIFVNYTNHSRIMESLDSFELQIDLGQKVWQSDESLVVSLGDLFVAANTNNGDISCQIQFPNNNATTANNTRDSSSNNTDSTDGSDAISFSDQLSALLAGTQQISDTSGGSNATLNGLIASFSSDIAMSGLVLRGLDASSQLNAFSSAYGYYYSKVQAETSDFAQLFNIRNSWVYTLKPFDAPTFITKCDVSNLNSISIQTRYPINYAHPLILKLGRIILPAGVESLVPSAKLLSSSGKVILSGQGGAYGSIFVSRGK